MNIYHFPILFIFNRATLVLSNEQKDEISFRNLIGNNTKLAKQNKSLLMR